MEHRMIDPHNEYRYGEFLRYTANEHASCFGLKPGSEYHVMVTGFDYEDPFPIEIQTPGRRTLLVNRSSLDRPATDAFGNWVKA